jgi:beta-lactamase class A
MVLTRQARVAVYIVAAFLLLAAGWHSHRLYIADNKFRFVKAGGFRFTNPLLDVELPEGLKVNNEPIPFKHKLKAYAERLKESGKASRISIYYRDLQDGPWFGVKAKEKFDPASMMKVPVMIAWLKRAEKDPVVLKRTFVHDGKEDKNAWEDIKPRQAIISGRPYAVEELLRYMLNFSDNNATALLFHNLKTDEINAVMDGMDVNNSPTNKGNLISVHGYSGFFRILYNASFLNREMSEKALQLLSLQDFPQGFAAGLPKGTVVASKFGEQTLEGGVRQLHEFGIVYHPKGHYILGVMTEGKSLDELAGVIRDVAAITYAEVDKAVQLNKAGVTIVDN